MSSQLFIPERIKVGFQSRSDCYTGSLAYVIYYRNGELKQQTSWDNWRDKKIEAIEFDNKPTVGFVLNKGVGGVRQSYGWNTRNEYVRVYDPRDFEFEISVPNLLFILRECDCSKGKGLEGQFVYAWGGAKPTLLPVGCEEYKSCTQFTGLQGKRVKAKELILGASYTTNRQLKLIYLGRFDYHFIVCTEDYRFKAKYASGVCKRFVFWNPDSKSEKDGFVYKDDMSSIAELNSDVVSPDYAELVEKYNRSPHGSRVAKLFLKEVATEKKNHWDSDTWYYEESDGVFVQCQTQHKDRYNESVSPKPIEFVSESSKFVVQDGRFVQLKHHARAYPPGVTPPTRSNFWERRDADIPIVPYREPTDHRLFALMESGKKYRFDNYIFNKE